MLTRDDDDNRAIVRMAAQTLWEGGCLRQPFTVSLNTETGMMTVVEYGGLGRRLDLAGCMPRQCCEEHAEEDELNIARRFWDAVRYSGMYPS